MANINNEGADNNPDSSKDGGLDKSFVGKFVSGIFNSTPLSKWFGKDSTSKSTIRRREEDDDDLDDTSTVVQPPSKRAKLPPEVEYNNYSVFESPVTVHNASNNVNNVSKSKVFGRFPEPLPGPSGIKSRKLFDKHVSDSTNTVSSYSEENQIDVVNGENDSDSGESTSGYSSAPKLVNKQTGEIFCEKDTSEKVTPKARSLFTSTNDFSESRSLFTERSPQMNTSLSSRRPAFNASTFGSPNFVDRTISTKKILTSPFYSGQTIYGGASAYGRRFNNKFINDEQQHQPKAPVHQIKPVNEKTTIENATLSKTARRILNTLEQYSSLINDAKKIPVTVRKPGLVTNYVGATPYLTRDRKKPVNRELQVPSVPDLLQMKQKERLQNSTETVRQIATKSKSSLNKEEYKLRTEEDDKQKHSNKMKNTRSSSVRLKTQPNNEPISDVQLPKVSLPITTLPKFDLVLAPPPQTKTTPPTTTTKKANNHYTFSDPLIISKELKSIKAINCFKFSEPLCKKVTEDTKTVKNNGENVKYSACDEPKTTNHFGDQFKMSADKWECQVCLVRNANTDAKCVACETPKPSGEKPKPVVSGFGDKFKPPASTWECTSCLIRNKDDLTVCAACGAAKPTFSDKFKPATDTWECPTCMIRNKNQLDKCEACETVKPGTKPPPQQQKTVSFNFGIKPTTQWECKSCLIKNSNELGKCAACQTPKSGDKKGFGDAFKMKSDEWECSSCLVKNKSTNSECVCCGTVRPGQTAQKLVDDKKPVNSFNFGIDKGAPQFQFGIPMKAPPTPTTVSFGFGLPTPPKETPKPAANPLLKPSEKLPEKATPAPVGFKFGIDNSPKTNSNNSESVVKTPPPPMFQFKPLAVNGDINKPVGESNKPAEETSTTNKPFGDTNKPSFGETSKPLGDTNNKPKETTLVDITKPKPVLDDHTKKPIFGTKEPSPAFSVEVKKPTQDSPFASQTKPESSPFGQMTKPKSNESSPFTNPLKRSESPFNKPPTDSPFGKPSPFSKPSTESPFGKPTTDPPQFGLTTKQTTSPFGKPTTESLFTDSNKPTKESIFDLNKSQQPFGGGKVNDNNKPQENIFGGDSTKPKDSPFGAKPPPPKETTNLFTTPTTASTFSFAPKAAAPAAESTAPIFKFGVEPPALPPPRVKPDPMSNGFGLTPKAPVFGASQPFPGTSDIKPPPAFGSTENKPFSFSSSNDVQPKPPSFGFGQTDKPNQSGPVFNFGSAAAGTAPPPANTTNPGFNFSVPSGGFNFGSKVESQPFPPSNNVFGSAGTGAKNGSFNFGTNAANNNNNQKAVFTFGSNQTSQPSFPTQQSQQPGFNFGPAAPVVNVPGSFNFTGAPSSFNFNDGNSAQAQPQRKIKKALRRTHR